jgi:hypothetical protein
MNNYVIHDAQGNVVSCGRSEGQLDQRISSDHTQLWINFPSDIENYRVVGGVLVEISSAEVSARELQEAWSLLRGLRDYRLAASDWTQATDAPVNQAAWATYRQQLRDLPSNTTDPANPVWPSPPS